MKQQPAEPGHADMKPSLHSLRNILSQSGIYVPLCPALLGVQSTAELVTERLRTHIYAIHITELLPQDEQGLNTLLHLPPSRRRSIEYTPDSFVV